MECIVLAGGLGTRLQGVIGAMPKCMAVINGKPFLHYLFQYLEQHNCSKVILSLGFKHEVVCDWIADNDWQFDIETVIENEPLGTGGGIRLALAKAKTENIIVLNGDTMFRVDLTILFSKHISSKSVTTLALKPMKDFSRYGVVHTNASNQISNFEEKKQYAQGTINGGVYVINKAFLCSQNLPTTFSFEQDYLEKLVVQNQFYGFDFDDYFIDIGIPEDYNKAQKDFTEF